ncbi:uncharacterized protein LOC116770675 isoform X2 [Danaus plexippus]|uniref:uncharacterized protein LOC116770675 isoform X2 n=1 Tax=Danaus plexippus TaxID=13037 RepID=UPI002AB1418E|nr:uncharacterized protein LOC116770675 isoform X2 [Danaus plexippus]
MSKKSRGPNFSSKEKEILIHLIDKYKEIIGNKKTDAVTIAAKNQGWEKLTEEFNLLSSFCSRKVDQLKTCWDNLKRTTRKVKALVKRESLLTGRPAINPPGPLQARIESLLGPSLDGLDNVLDSDSHSIEENDTMYVEVLAETETEEDKETEAGPSQAQKAEKENLQSDNTDNSWRNWTPAALKTKASSPLKRKNNPISSLSPSSWLHRRRQRTSLHEKVLQNKIGLLEILKQNAHREAELKTKLLEEQIKQELIKTKILTLELKKLQQ